MPGKPRSLARIQFFAVAILSVAGVVNYVDRGSLAIANTTIRADLHISATRMGVLLSVFSLSYAVCQLPVGALLDRFGERVVLSAGMLLWSVTQMATGLVSGFLSFVAARIGLAAGESSFVVSAVKAVHDWFDVKQRATPMGIVNASTTMGQAIAPPIVTAAMLAFGWRTMFMLIGVPSALLSILWFVFYRNRDRLSQESAETVDLESAGAINEPFRISLVQWMGLFRLRTVWGLMLGFGGVNYTVWMYMSWMPNYLEAEHKISVAATGTIAMIPFAMGAAGMFVSGVIADFLVRRGVTPIASHKSLLVTGMTCSALCTFMVPAIATATGAAFGIGSALFFIYLAGNSGWGLVQCIAPPEIVASIATIQNFGSFICASIAPVVTGWMLDRTHSFNVPLFICAGVAIFGALIYLYVVKYPIAVPISLQQRGGSE